LHVAVVLAFLFEVAVLFYFLELMSDTVSKAQAVFVCLLYRWLRA